MKERFPENITGSQTRENLNKMARMELIALMMSIVSLIASIGSLVYSIKIGNELYEPEFKSAQLKEVLSDETGTGSILTSPTFGVPIYDYIPVKAIYFNQTTGKLMAKTDSAYIEVKAEDIFIRKMK